MNVPYRGKLRQRRVSTTTVLLPFSGLKTRNDKLFFLPFLKTIFNKKTEDEKFMYMLRNGFGAINVQAINHDVINSFNRSYGCELSVNMLEPNIPSTVILSLILNHLGVDGHALVALEKEQRALINFFYAVDTVERYVTFGGERRKPHLRIQEHSLEEVDKAPEIIKPSIFEGNMNVIAGYRYRVTFDGIVKEVKDNSEM